MPPTNFTQKNLEEVRKNTFDAIHTLEGENNLSLNVQK